MQTTWRELNPGTRRIIMVAAALDGIARAVALLDLGRRPASEVRGSKAAWATALTVVSSVGLLPLVYFLRGRRRN